MSKGLIIALIGGFLCIVLIFGYSQYLANKAGKDTILFNNKTIAKITKSRDPVIGEVTREQATYSSMCEVCAVITPKATGRKYKIIVITKFIDSDGEIIGVEKDYISYPEKDSPEKVCNYSMYSCKAVVKATVTAELE